MADDFKTILDYLIPPTDSFWKWSDDLEAIVWNDGRTIAFRLELASVLRLQVSQGLPPLSAVVLLMAACRDSWGEFQLGLLHELRLSSPGGVELLVQHVRRKGDGRKRSRIEWHELAQSWLDEIDARLREVRALPAEIRSDLNLRTELLDAVFEGCLERTPPGEARSIVDTLQDGLSPELLECIAWCPPERILDELDVLSEGLRRFDPHKLRLRYETSLDRDVVPAEIEEPLAKRVRKLFDRMQNDEELAGMVRLARNLMAVVHLPRPLDDRDEIPVGGISDISNRGTLDRLLISELAQDDETLMLRVAMNEALFLRRETPPRNPPRSRFVVLDSGLRMWGVPRVFATSVALSLAALSDPHVELSALRPEGRRLTPVDLASRDGLIAHLKALRPEAHPGGALADLTRCIGDGDGDRETDTVLITGENVLADRDFQRQLTACEQQIAFVVTVSRGGRFRLLERTLHGVKQLREATLDVESLLAPPRKPALPLIDPKHSADLPAILRVHPFPLRLPHQVSPRQTWGIHRDGFLSVTNDHRLMHWDDPKLGGRQLTDRLPSRRVHWSRPLAQGGRTQFVIGNEGKPELWLATADLETPGCDATPLHVSSTPVRCVCSHAGVLFVVHSRNVDVCDMFSGNRLTTVDVPQGMQWINGRFFRGSGRWVALSYDGATARFETVVEYRDCQDGWALLTMFDVQGIEGPVGISSRSGSLFCTAEKAVVPLIRPLMQHMHVRAVSRDGRLACVEHGVSTPGKRETVLINTMDGTVSVTCRDPEAAVNAGIDQIVPRNLIKRFASAGLDGDVESLRICLRTRKATALVIWYDEIRDAVCLGNEGSIRDWSFHHVQQFESVSFQHGKRFGLKIAKWKSGARVFLDSRGLLHLMPADRTIPEATLVLCGGPIAGWCADGRIWGPDYFLFHGHCPTVSAKEIFEDVIQPFVRSIS